MLVHLPDWRGGPRGTPAGTALKRLGRRQRGIGLRQRQQHRIYLAVYQLWQKLSSQALTKNKAELWVIVTKLSQDSREQVRAESRYGGKAQRSAQWLVRSVRDRNPKPRLRPHPTGLFE